MTDGPPFQVSEGEIAYAKALAVLRLAYLSNPDGAGGGALAVGLDHGRVLTERLLEGRTRLVIACAGALTPQVVASGLFEIWSKLLELGLSESHFDLIDIQLCSPDHAVLTSHALTSLGLPYDETDTLFSELLRELGATDSDEGLSLQPTFGWMWERLSLLYCEDAPYAGSFAGPVHSLEQNAMAWLANSAWLGLEGSAKALRALRLLLLAVEQSDVPLLFDRADVQSALLTISDRYPADLPGRVISRGSLAEARSVAATEFVARPPTWADVAQGPGPGRRLVARSQSAELLAELSAEGVGSAEHGADVRLRATFVVGAPGAGKSTLVRQVVAEMVQAGSILALDFGVNQGPLPAEELELHLTAVRALASCGRHVLVVMDDPLFAKCGWDDFVRRLARLMETGHLRNVSIVAASPSFLFEAYRYMIRDQRVVVHQLEMAPPDLTERRDLAVAFGREAGVFDEREEEFIVLAMEAAFGVSFDEIISRIWLTLNDGEPIPHRARPSDLPWPVRALLIISFFDRHSTSCPERLLVSSLRRGNGGAAEGDYREALRELQFAEGWHIFVVSEGEYGSETVFTTLHTTVAKRLWDLSPAPQFDISEWIVPASLDAPESAPYVAQLANVGRRGTQWVDRTFAKALVEAWTADTVPTRQMGELLRDLDDLYYTGAAPQLRRRMRRDDDESWIAAWCLARRARAGSEDRSTLLDVRLPTALRKANLSASPRLAFEVGARRQYRDAVVELLLSDLVDSRALPVDPLLAWLVRTRPEELAAHATDIDHWLTEADVCDLVLRALMAWVHTQPEKESAPLVDVLLRHGPVWINRDLAMPRDAGAFAACLALVVRQLSKPGAEALSEAVEGIRRWLEDHSDDDGDLIGASMVVTVGNHVDSVANARTFLEFVSNWMRDRRAVSATRARYLEVLPRLELDFPDLVSQVLSDSWLWLGGHPADVIVRSRFLSVVERLGEASPVPLAVVLPEVWLWLKEHPDETHLRAGFLGVVGRLGEASPAPLAVVLPEVWVWLKDHPDDHEVRAGFLGVVGRLGEASPVPLAVVLPEVWLWLKEHPEETHLRAHFLVAAASIEDPHPLLAEVVAETEVWLARHPQDTIVRAAFVEMTHMLGDESPTPLSKVPETVGRWLDHHPGDSFTRAKVLQLGAGVDLNEDTLQQPLDELADGTI